MLNLVPKEFVVFAGLLAIPAVSGLCDYSPPRAAVPVPPSDPRLSRLSKFFAERNCPVQALAAEFLRAADRNALDWRLLPSISVIESGGGKEYRNNNIFGWGSSAKAFPSVRAGIHIVAQRLATSPLYKDKDVDGILSTYNPSPEYGERVKAVMRMIGKTDLSAVPGAVD